MKKYIYNNKTKLNGQLRKLILNYISRKKLQRFFFRKNNNNTGITNYIAS